MTKTILPPVKKGARIGLLGGSFDPPHLGHSLLALSFLALEPIDELWIIPCQSHAFKGELNSFAQRMHMCKLAFERLDHVRVLDLESQIEAPNYTIKTLNLIWSKRPDLKLYFAIGSDLISGFYKWHQAEAILERAFVVVFERQNYPIELPALLKNAHVHQGFILPDTNSTMLRNSFKQRKNTHALIDQKVGEYIKRLNMYSDSKVPKM